LSTQPLFSVSNNPTSNGQTLNVPVSGFSSFDPGAGSFGFYSNWPFFGARNIYSEDALNTFANAIPHHVRVYPLKNSAGTVVPNAYIVATEETTSGFDYQDIVVIVRNVTPIIAGGPEITATPELVFSTVRGTQSASQTITINNLGSGTLEINSVQLGGANAASFTLLNPPTTPVSLTSGQRLSLDVRFNPGSSQLGSLSAQLTVTSNDADEGTLNLGLFGLALRGLEGNNEPPFQDVVNTLGYPVNVGGTGLIIGTGADPIGDEVLVPLFQKAGSGPVSVTPVARFSPNEVLPYGYYTLNSGNPQLSELAQIANGQFQTLNPAIVPGGLTSFDPGAASFGFYVDSNTFNRVTYTQDGLNTGPTRHAVRAYPLKDRSGALVPNAYLIGFEDAANGDYQDYVFVLRNVRPASSGSNVTAKINFQPDSATVPTGYTKDSGLGFDAARGFGWVTPGTNNPLSLAAQTRERNLNSDQRLDTLIIMGPGANSSFVNGAWEYALPNGSYEVTVGVGDPSFVDSVHRINVEGTTLINNFVPTTEDLHRAATITVVVSDGRLTIDQIGGTQTKINYVDISAVGTATPDTTAPVVSVAACRYSDYAGHVQEQGDGKHQRDGCRVWPGERELQPEWRGLPALYRHYSADDSGQLQRGWSCGQRRGAGEHLADTQLQHRHTAAEQGRDHVGESRRRAL
ncbi:choice-of-anchor D domain-containing protein, partial [Candidatus Gracilibacteria bacterium]|nr:choice-of-anchor D domain-containing protein [Candidatus Gracilibacteria bacterium]